jgi:hypothetical protein
MRRTRCAAHFARIAKKSYATNAWEAEGRQLQPWRDNYLFHGVGPRSTLLLFMGRDVSVVCRSWR